MRFLISIAQHLNAIVTSAAVNTYVSAVLEIFDKVATATVSTRQASIFCNTLFICFIFWRKE